MGPWETALEIVRATLLLLTHLWGGSLGWGIVSLSVLVRLAVLPWTLRAARRSAAMRDKLKALGPELERLKQRHAKDPVALRGALTREYERAGIRPLRRCGGPHVGPSCHGAVPRPDGPRRDLERAGGDRRAHATRDGGLTMALADVGSEREGAIAVATASRASCVNS
jgi:hypothetical protein